MRDAPVGLGLQALFGMVALKHRLQRGEGVEVLDFKGEGETLNPKL